MTDNRDFSRLAQRLRDFPTARAAHTPTPVEALPRLGATLDLSLYVKRDDCTGFAFGGNKVRQLEYYLGAALAESADTLLITGAVQSNFVRTAAAMAARFGMDCVVQLEDRVAGASALYRENGNVLLDRLLGAQIIRYPVGEDESGADAALYAAADALRAKGKRPYVVTLGTDHPPLGALGYAEAALEIAAQGAAEFDEIIVGSGSASTHTGLLFGLRALGIETPVRGICVRRASALQTPRVQGRIADLGALLAMPEIIPACDVETWDGTLTPGYGKLNDATTDAIRRTAAMEGLFLDPTYTGKVMAGLITLAERRALRGKRVLFWHTGGQPGLFAYGDQL